MYFAQAVASDVSHKIPRIYARRFGATLQEPMGRLGPLCKIDDVGGVCVCMSIRAYGITYIYQCIPLPDLSIYLNTYLFVCLSIRLSIHPSIHLRISLCLLGTRLLFGRGVGRDQGHPDLASGIKRAPIVKGWLFYNFMITVFFPITLIVAIITIAIPVVIVLHSLQKIHVLCAISFLHVCSVSKVMLP